MVRIAIAPFKVLTVLFVMATVAAAAYTISEPTVLESMTAYLRDHVGLLAAPR